MASSSEPPSPTSVRTLLLFLTWWFSNNLYAIDTHAFFASFPSVHYVPDLVLAQHLLACFLLSLYRVFFQNSSTPPFNGLPNNPTRTQLALLLAIGSVQAAGALLTVASYAVIGASSTLAWKLTEPLPALLFKRVLLRVPLSFPSILSVLVVVSGVLTFTAGFETLTNYAPIISSNLIFPLRNVFIKLGERNHPHSENSHPLQQFWHMQLFGLPIAVALMLLRLPLSPLSLHSVPYLLRNALLFNTYQFASIYLLSIFDTLAHSLLNTFKRFSAVIFATAVIQRSFEPHQFFGISLAFIGFLSYLLVENKLFPAFKLPAVVNKIMSPLLIFLIVVPAFSHLQSFILPSRHQQIELASNYHTHIVVVLNASRNETLNQFEKSHNIPEVLSTLAELPPARTEVCVGLAACHLRLSARSARSVILHIAHDSTRYSTVEDLSLLHSLSRHLSVRRVLATNLLIRAHGTEDSVSLRQQAQSLKELPVDLLVREDLSKETLKNLGFKRSAVIGSFAFFTHLQPGRSLSPALSLKGRVERLSEKLARKIIVSVVDTEGLEQNALLQTVLKVFPSALLLVFNDKPESIRAMNSSKAQHMKATSSLANIVTLIVKNEADLVITDSADHAAVAAAAGVPAMLLPYSSDQAAVLNTMRLPVVSWPQPTEGKAGFMTAWSKLPAGWANKVEETRCALATRVKQIYNNVGLSVAKGVADACSKSTMVSSSKNGS